MRIGFISQWYDPEGGSAAIPGGLVRGLLRAGHSVGVVTGFPNYPFGHVYEGYRQHFRFSENLGGAQVQRVPLLPSHSRRAAHRMASYASFAASSRLFGLRRLEKCDAYIAYATPISAALAPLANTSRTPVLTIVPDLWPDTLVASQFSSKGKFGRLLYWLAKKMSAYVYQNSAVVACSSSEMRRLLIARGLDPNRVITVYNWIDEDIFNQGVGNVQGGTEFAGPDFLVLYAGNLGPLQDLDNLLDAADLIRNETHIRIVIVGSGTEERRLRARAKSMALSNVDFVSQISANEVAAFLRRADVHVISLIDREPFQATIPSKLQYSMASGKPIISAVRGETNQHVQDSGCGLAIAPSDADALASAILRMARMSDVDREQMGRDGYAYYQATFSERVGVQTLQNALEMMIQK